MARQMSMESLEAKIEKAEQNVIRTKKAYDVATEELKKLLDKRDAIRRDEIMSAVVKSKKSYDEILRFLEEGSQEMD